MLPIDFEGTNTVFIEGEGLINGEQMPIKACVGRVDDGRPFILTVWQPSKEDIEAINIGRPINIAIFGNVMQPMNVYTLDEFHHPNI